MPLVSASGDGGALLRVKAVPGASRSRVAGRLGDRLKVAVAAPPERGRANRELCEVVAAALGLPTRAVTLESGAGSPTKTLRIRGMTPEDVLRRLGATP